MKQYGIALDIGTSGFRAQALDLECQKVISSVISTNHPLPGHNVIDHLHFAIELGIERANSIVIEAVNKVLKQLAVPLNKITKLAICGNPVQLSLFQGTEIRDLAFSGSEKLKSLNLEVPLRNARVLNATSIQKLKLPKNCKILIPPAVYQEVGADAIALVLQTAMHKRRETAIAIDFGTNAEMVLQHNGKLFSASAAAGAAIEGKQIECGMLAAPGAIADLEVTGAGYRLVVLNSDLIPVKGHITDIACLSNPFESKKGIVPKGITGTGTIAIVKEAMDLGLLNLPDICTRDKMLHFGGNIRFTNSDVKETGKAIGAIRAGYYTLCQHIKLPVEEIRTVYMAGASGTYLNPAKAQKLGLIPPTAKNVVKAGNTSLAMARQLVMNEECLDEMTVIANEMRKNYYSLAASEIFKKVFILELSYWTEGMPMKMYRDFLQKYGFQDIPEKTGTLSHITGYNMNLYPEAITRIVTLGKTRNLKITGCTLCLKCRDICPVKAVAINTNQSVPVIRIEGSKCLGLVCKKCENICPGKVFHFLDFFE